MFLRHTCCQAQPGAAAGAGQPSEHTRLRRGKAKCTLFRRGEEKTFALERSLYVTQTSQNSEPAVPCTKGFKTRPPPKTHILGRRPDFPQCAHSFTSLLCAYCVPGTVLGSPAGREGPGTHGHFGRRQEQLACSHLARCCRDGALRWVSRNNADTRLPGEMTHTWM